ncbi:hypothetical protein [uncultured Chryseobacterium sp.]|uniref:hypothetical protein n=1 Tax=uncultured Chryseobacterium sp. TaxID=259322 RepID=UPI0025F5D7BE|nr:hypothetical protein [uncultured Chryseobacterium sp.]
MDLQTRKSNLITYLAQIQDEHFFDKIEEYILARLKREDYLKALSFKELNKRIDQSLEDSKSNNMTESNDLLSEIKQWQ